MTSNKEIIEFQQFMLFLSKCKEIEALKFFPKINYYKKNGNPLREVEFKPFNGYIFCTSSIHEKRLLLARFINKFIRIGNVFYFPLKLPSDPELEQRLLLILDEAEIKFTTKLTVSWDSKIEVKRLDIRYEMPKYWRDKIYVVENILLENPVKYTTYRPSPKKGFFPLYILEKSAKEFVNLHNTSAYNFYYNALMYHIAYYTGLFAQYSVNKVLAKTESIRALLPKNLTLDKLLTISNSSTHKIVKCRSNLVFTYDIDELNALYCHKEGNKTVKHQRINVPIKLLPQVFKAEAFGRNGLAFFLLLVFGLRCRNPKVNYKPSTIVNLANINTKRGIDYTINAINKPLNYFKDLKLLVFDFDKVTKESYKADIAIKIDLLRLLSV